MASSLRRSVVGRWYAENRVFVIVGIAQPQRMEQWGVLAVTLLLIAPSVSYLSFLSMRACDLIRSLRQKINASVLWRLAGVSAFMVSCVAGIVFGGVILGVDFGLRLDLVVAFLILLNILQLQWMKSPARRRETTY